MPCIVVTCEEMLKELDTKETRLSEQFPHLVAIKNITNDGTFK